MEEVKETDLEKINMMLMQLVLRMATVEEVLISKGIVSAEDLVDRNLKISNKMVDFVKETLAKKAEEK